MQEKTINVRLNYEGEFKKTVYVGGKNLLVNRVEVDTFSYTVLMEFVKDYLNYTEIGGIYISKGRGGGWELMTKDAEVIGLITDCVDGEEINFYIDNTIDKEIEPMIQMQPHVIIRPRNNIIQASAKKAPVKRKFVTRHQLQKQQQKEMNKKSPDIVVKRKEFSAQPVLMSGQQDVCVNEKATARRKLELEKDSSDSEKTAENEVSVQLPPPPPLTQYEKNRLRQMQENAEVCKKLGVPLLVCSLKKGKGKKEKEKEPEDCDSQYFPENEGDDQSDGLLERIKTVKTNKIQLGPRTRSRVNATLGNKELKKARTEKEVTSSYCPPLVKPTCSKVFRQTSKDEAAPGAGTVAAYLALRERQKKNEAARTEENVDELNMDETMDVEVEEVRAPKRPRGPTKMSRVHGRNPEEKKVISLNAKGQAISESERDIAELSNFLGTLARDNVSLTYINWHVVPDQLKQTLWEYTLGRYVIPEEGQKWVYNTMNSAWKLHKARMKQKFYSRYDTDEERLEHRTERIPLEDFKMLLKYWGDESVKKLAAENAQHRKALVETHTLGRKPVSLVIEEMKKTDPMHASPCDAKIYSDSRKRQEGRTYKSNTIEIKDKITKIQQLMEEGKEAEANAVASNGKTHAPNWLVGRLGKKTCTGSTSLAPTEDYIQELTTKIKHDLQGEFEVTVNKKVQENMAWMLKKLGEANPDLKLDIGQFCATISSDQEDIGTPTTQAGTT